MSTTIERQTELELDISEKEERWKAIRRERDIGVCMWVCVRERERESERESGREEKIVI